MSPVCNHQIYRADVTKMSVALSTFWYKPTSNRIFLIDRNPVHKGQLFTLGQNSWTLLEPQKDKCIQTNWDLQGKYRFGRTCYGKRIRNDHLATMEIIGWRGLNHYWVIWFSQDYGIETQKFIQLPWPSQIKTKGKRYWSEFAQGMRTAVAIAAFTDPSWLLFGFWKRHEPVFYAS